MLFGFFLFFLTESTYYVNQFLHPNYCLFVQKVNQQELDQLYYYLSVEIYQNNLTGIFYLFQSYINIILYYYKYE